MAVSAYLVDKSVLARMDNRAVLAGLQPYVGQLATCGTVLLEMGWSARNSDHYAQMREDMSWFAALEIDQAVIDRALGLQDALVRRGHHRGPGVSDLVLAATALQHDAVLLHYDHDFELIAEVAELRHQWIVPRGSVD